MKISMIVPVHNAAKTLRRCVESLTARAYPELEIILVENNSTDESWELCQTLQRQYDAVVSIQTTTVGVSAARNIGLRHASGDIIGFADADDAVREDVFDLVSRGFLQHPECNVVVTGNEKVYTDRPSQVYRVSREQKWTYGKMLRHVLCDHAVSGYVFNKFWRAEALEGVYFREDLSHSEDTHFVVNALASKPGGYAYVLNVSTYDYYQQPDSATAQVSRMFDEADRLKLIVAARAMLDDFSLTWYDRVLMKRLIFSMASSQYLRFRKALEPGQAQNLKTEMLHSVLCYLATFYVAPLDTLKRLLRLAGI